MHFDFDTYKGVPTFLEIESNSEKKVLKMCKNLGIAEKKTKNWTGKEVLQYYRKWNRK